MTGPVVLPMDMPKAAQRREVVQIFGVDLLGNGDISVDGKKLSGEEELLPLAREAQAKDPELRAVIRADSTVQHGRVVRALDLLKEAGREQDHVRRHAGRAALRRQASARRRAGGPAGPRVPPRSRRRKGSGLSGRPGDRVVAASVRDRPWPPGAAAG